MPLLIATAPIAGSNPGADLFPQVIGWLGAMAALAVVGAIVIMVLARRLRADDGDEPDGLTLEGIRELRRRGQLTDEEFDRARSAIVDAARRSASRRTDAGPKHAPRADRR
ncbi:MAG: hypothetical protein KDA22_08395 [Phycisphaerales bacterium]|nr:hypothetical protein [Phycisphaerales bacterium]